MGGLSAEREVSLDSGKAVLDALLSKSVDAYGIDADRDVTLKLQSGKYDRVFIILHGPWGEDGVIQGALETMGIPYTGSGVLASALAMDKYRSKLFLQCQGIATPKFILLNSEDDFPEAVASLGFPMAIKPNRLGSSVGISKVKSADQLSAAWELARKYDKEVLAEQWIDGHELNVSILGDQALPVVKVETTREFYDYQAKYEDDSTDYICPSGLGQKLEEKVQRLALSVFNLLGCRGWGRVEFLVDVSGNPLVLEVNTVPGMTSHSLAPMAARQAGISFEQLAVRILETSYDS